MCGIAGIFERDTDNTQLMSEMLTTIEHRGPDDQIGRASCRERV